MTLMTAVIFFATLGVYAFQHGYFQVTSEQWREVASRPLVHITSPESAAEMQRGQPVGELLIRRGHRLPVVVPSRVSPPATSQGGLLLQR